MNVRQRDLFLWQWSKRRELGYTTVALRGGGIGAIGGLFFALILGSNIGGETPHDSAWLLQMLGLWAKLLMLSVPSFACIGYLGATRVFRSHERMFQNLLAQGVHIPAQAPSLSLGDRGPAIAVGVAVGVMSALVLAAVVFLG